MNRKTGFSTEMAYVLGIVILAFGTALMERADFGMSMVVAPAYLVHLKLSETFSWFSFGMAEYCFQAALLILLGIVMRRFKRMYLFSFVTAVIYGFVLDAVIWVVSFFPMGGIAGRMLFFVAGMLVCSAGVALLFHTYIAPEAYELFVKEASEKFHSKISRTKTIYDCVSCLIAVILSFAFYGIGHFEGIKAGTIVCALINGWIIGQISRWLEGHFDFRDVLKMRRYFSS